MIEQVCRRCLTTKPLNDFYFSQVTYKYWSICKHCKQNSPAKLREKLELKSLSKMEKKNMDVKVCLGCEEDFLSKSKFNRLCVKCRDMARDDW